MEFTEGLVVADIKTGPAGSGVSLGSIDYDTTLKNLEQELGIIQSKIDQCEINGKYTELVTFFQKIDTKKELSDIRLYILTQLQISVEKNFAIMRQELSNTYGLDEEEKKLILDQSIYAMQRGILKKLETLVSMESIGYAMLTDNSTEFEKTDIPESMTKVLKNLPKENSWQELSTLVDYVGLLIVQKEYRDTAQLIRLSRNSNHRLLSLVQGDHK